MGNGTGTNSITVLKKSDRAPPGAMEANTLFNPALYLKTVGQNGGQVSLTKYEDNFIDTQLLERFVELGTDAIPQKNGRVKTVRMRLAVSQEEHEAMERIYEHIMATSEGPISHTNAMAFFTFSFIRRLLRLESFDDLQRLIAVLDFYDPDTFEDVLEAMKQIRRRN